MFQYFKYESEHIKEAVYSVMVGKQIARFFAKQVIYVCFLVYATLFLAAAIPFLSPHFWGVYVVGGVLSLAFFVRLVNYVVMYLRYRESNILFSPRMIEIKNSSDTIQVPAEEIQYLEYTLLGNLIVHTKSSKVLFPVGLLPEDQRNLLGQLVDVAPARTAVFKKLWEVFDAIVMAMILAVHIIQFVIQNYYIPTESMKDTLMIGDHLFAEKITYGPIIPQMLGMDKPVHLNFLSIRKVERGDIIIFRPPAPADQDKDYIKRCIAVEGDEFHIKDDHVYINGVRQEEPYTKGKTNYRGFNKGLIEGIVPKGKVIAMGDNRENSSDSRYFGYLPVERIKAKALFLYWNTTQIQTFDFSRFGFIK